MQDQELEYVEFFESVRPPRTGGFDAPAFNFGRGPNHVTDRPPAILPYLRKNEILGPIVVLKDIYRNEVLVPWHQVKVFSLPKEPVQADAPPAPVPSPPATPGKTKVREEPHEIGLKL